MKLLTLIAALLLIATPCAAGPKHVLRKVAEVFVYAAPIAASAFATHEAHECRLRNGVAPCAGGYGPFVARESIRMGVSVTLSGLSMYGHKQGYKEWFVMGLGAAAFNGVVAVRESRVNKKDKS